MKARLTGKRITAAVAAAAMAGSVVSFEAFAYTDSGSYDNSFTFTNSGVTASNTAGSGYKISGTDLTINAAGTYVVSGQCAEGSITVKKGTTGVVLVLDALTLTCSSTAPVSVNKGAEAEIVIKGSNTLTDSENPANENFTDETVADAFEGAGIKVKTGSALTLTGSGTLTVNGSSCKNGIKGAATSTITVGESAADSFTLNVNAANNALAADGELIINGGNVNINSADDGLKASPDDDDTESKGVITMNSGKVTVTASNDAVHADQVNILGGELTITAGDDALKAEYELTVGKDDGSGPDINVKKAYEGFEGATITLKGGKGSIISSDDGMNAANSELNNYSFLLNITGGDWYVNADGDGVDSNGNMSISGGFTEVFGAANDGNGALDIGDNGCSLTYTGGTIAAFGMSGMAVVPTSGNYIAFGTSGMGGGGFGGPRGQSSQSGSSFSITNGAAIAIKDSSGNTVYETTAVKNANHVVFAADSLKSDETYTLYVNGQSAATATLTAGSGQQGGQGGQPGNPGQPWNPWQQVTYTLVPAVEATQTTAGNSEYYVGSDGKYYVLENGRYTEIEQDSWIIPATGFDNPTISYVAGNGRVKLTWTAVENAEKYAVYGYIGGKWTAIAQGDTTSYILSGLKAGTNYKVVVLAKVNGEWNYDDSNAIVVTPNSVSATAYPVAAVAVSGKQFKLTWTAADNAEKYAVAVYMNGKWKVIKNNIANNVFTYISPANGTPSGTYKVAVAAYVDGKWDLTDIADRAVTVTIE